MKKNLVLLGLVVIFLNTANAQIVDEEFSHADGGLIGQTPVPGPGGAWVAHSGEGNNAIQVSSGAITLNHGPSGGEDVNTSFTAIGAGEKIYAGFDFTLPSGQTVNPDGNGLYFAHFGDAGFGFRARTFVVVPTGAGDFSMALDGNGSIPSATWATDLSFDTTYHIIISYDFDTGNTQLWVDASLESDTSISDMLGTSGTAVDDFSLRQSNDYSGSMVIDNLIVADTFGVSLPVELINFSVE